MNFSGMTVRSIFKRGFAFIRNRWLGRSGADRPAPGRRYYCDADPNYRVSKSNLKPVIVRPKPTSIDKILLFAVMRNEMLRLPAFLSHYRRLGVEHFILVDNSSSDGSLEYLKDMKDVTAYSTADRYSEAGCGHRWLEHLLSKHGLGRWCVVADIDEFLVYPEYGKKSLHQLARELEDDHSSALRSLLVDMYADAPISAVHYAQGDNPLETASWCDPDGYQVVKAYEHSPHQPRITGGMRQRLFQVDVLLDKVPFIKMGPEVKLSQGAHSIVGSRVSVAPSAVLHFKYFQDFYGRILEEVERKEHYAGAQEYSAYAEVLRRNPHLNMKYEGSISLDNSLDRICRLMRSQIPAYQAEAHPPPDLIIPTPQEPLSPR